MSMRVYLGVVVLAVVSGTAKADLVHEWGFDGSYADSVGGGSYGGTANGSVNTSSPGKFGTGCVSNFNGTADYVSINTYFSPPGTSGDSSTGTRSYSVSAWINGYDNDWHDAAVFTWGQNGTNGQSEQIRLSGNAGNGVGNLTYGCWNGSQWESVTGSNVNDASGTNWHLLTVTRSGGTVTTYVDGTNAISGNVSAASPSLGSVAIGNQLPGNYGSSTYNFSGKIDDVGVWNNVMTGTQVAALFSLGNDSVLNYNAKDAQSLFGIFAGGPGTQGSTTDGKTWKYTTGLLGAAGSVINGDTALILDGAGDGVSIIPEPGMLTLLGTALLGLLAYAWRKCR